MTVSLILAVIALGLAIYGLVKGNLAVVAVAVILLAVSALVGSASSRNLFSQSPPARSWPA